jgi:uncharacterized membrane-anchored protein YhcB (DUF1043 family)
MSSRTRWIIGLLLALVVGLAVGQIIVAGDESDDSTTVTLESTAESTRSEATETLQTEPTHTSTTGGTTAPGPADAGGSGSGL